MLWEVGRQEGKKRAEMSRISDICWGGALSEIIFAHVGVVGVDMSLLDLFKNTLEVVKGLL